MIFAVDFVYSGIMSKEGCHKSRTTRKWGFAEDILTQIHKRISIFNILFFFGTNLKTKYIINFCTCNSGRNAL